MNVSFGKREQIVGLVVAGIVLIGTLHFLFFGQKAAEIVKSFDDLATALQEAQNVTPAEKSKLLELEKNNAILGQLYDDVMTSIGLHVNDAFKIPDPASILLTPEELEGTETLDDQTALKYLKAAQEKFRKFEQQTDLVFEEIEKLKTFDVEGRGTRMSFLGAPILTERMWNIPKALPQGVNADFIKDKLIALKTKIDVMGIAPNLASDAEEQYKLIILDLGIDLNRYENIDPEQSLLASGEFIPLIHKLAHAKLIEDELLRDAGDDPPPYTRTELFNLLEVFLPLESMMIVGGADEELGVSEMYFLYETLRLTNQLMEFAEKSGVIEISEVVIEPAAYLVKMERGYSDPIFGELPSAEERKQQEKDELLKDPALQWGAPWIKGPKNYKDFEGRMPPQQGLRKSVTDLGYCIPVTLRFSAPESAFWTFTHDFLMERQLSELDSFGVTPNYTVTQSPDNVILDAEVKFLVLITVFDR